MSTLDDRMKKYANRENLPRVVLDRDIPYREYQLAPCKYKWNFYQPIVFLTDEIWAESQDFPRYVISNYGRVYDKKQKCILLARIQPNGYKKISLYHPDKNGYVSIEIHRLVMRTFCPNSEYESLQVNHIDGVKNNNYYNPYSDRCNLEWCTAQENMEHATRTNLMSYGERTHSHAHTAEQARQAATLLAQGISADEILTKNMVEGLTKCQRDQIFIYNIKDGNWRRDVEDIYFPDPNRKRKEIHFHTEDEVRDICLLLHNGLDNHAIFSLLSQKYPYLRESFIEKLKMGDKSTRSWHHIREQYLPFKRFSPPKRTYTETEISLLCRLIRSGLRNTALRQAMGWGDTMTYNQMMALLSELKQNKNSAYRSISSKYFPDGINTPTGPDQASLMGIDLDKYPKNSTNRDYNSSLAKVHKKRS